MIPQSKMKNSKGKATRSSPRKRVRFAKTTEGQIMEEIHSPIHPRDSSQWMTREEWIEIRRQGQMTINSILSGDTIWSLARRHTYTNTMFRLWNCCLKGKEPSSSLKRELRFWASIGHSRRGLEKYSLPKVYDERQRRRYQHSSGVLFVQDQCYENRMDLETTSRLIRVASEKLSKASALFARLMAEADAEAVEYDAEEELALRLSDVTSEKLRTRDRTPSPPGDTSDARSVTNAAA
jgi:hypothetical protein